MVLVQGRKLQSPRHAEGQCSATRACHLVSIARTAEFVVSNSDSPIIPRDDLHKLGLELQDLTPSVIPQVVSSPKPILVPSGDVGIEPW